MSTMVDLSKIYGARFTQSGIERRRAVWRVLCRSFFDNLVPPDATVLDIACGYGEFINQIVARKKFAIDLNPDSPRYLNGDVSFLPTSATDLSKLPKSFFDVVFCSNFFEHLKEKKDLDIVLQNIFDVLKPEGKLIVLGPNIRYAYAEYWDFYDHYLPLSHLSMSEAIILAGFYPKLVIDRFLPYTMNNNAPTAEIIVKLYVKLPFVWKIFGKQFLVIGEKKI